MGFPRQVVITDYTDFEPERCFTRGKYWFRTIYTLVDPVKGLYEVRCETSAEFPFCPYLCTFQNCDSTCPCFDPETGECTAEPEVIPWDEVKKDIERAENNENFTVDIIEEPGGSSPGFQFLTLNK